MYFSAKQFHSYINTRNSSYAPRVLTTLRAVAAEENIRRQRVGRPQLRLMNSQQINTARQITMQQAKKYMRVINKHIADRVPYAPSLGVNVGKFMRPWTVVPELAAFAVPEGDIAFGVEVELPFRTTEAARTVAKKVMKWKYVTLDFEGGSIPIEATFPPMLYSKLTDKAQVLRYVQYLTDNRTLVAPSIHGGAGTHVNVSWRGLPPWRYGYDLDGQATQASPEYTTLMQRLNNVNGYLRAVGNTMGLNDRYFGRAPYGYGFHQGTHIEFKLFQSTVDPARVRQYIDIAVSLAQLLKSNEEVTQESVHQALERGFNKSVTKKRAKAKRVTPVVAPVAVAA